MKDTKEGASAAVGGSLFQSGIVLGKKLYLKQYLDVEYCLYLYLCADLVLSGSLWVLYQSARAQFCRENQLQFASSCFMRLPTEIVKHVRNAAGVPVTVCDKSCRSSLDHFKLVFPVTLVWTPDCRTVQ